MKFLDLFNPIKKGNYGLTDEMAYSSLLYEGEKIPLYGGNKQHIEPERYVSEKALTKKGKPITTFSSEGIIISLDGSAGAMTYKKSERFALNHHAGFITKLANAPIDLQFFALFFENHYKELAVSDGSKTLSLEQIYNEDFEVPPLSTQKSIIREIDPILKKRSALRSILKSIDHTRKAMLIDETAHIASSVPVSMLLECMSGNSGLTEELIYQNIPEMSGVEVLSSATTDTTAMGFIDESAVLPSGKTIKVYNGPDALLVARNGKAGTTRFLPAGKYTINDHAYILSKRIDCPYEFDLRWFAIKYKEQFLQYASSSDNGTWNKTGFFNSVEVDISDYASQMTIVKTYESLDSIENKILEIENDINQVFTAEITF